MAPIFRTLAPAVDRASPDASAASRRFVVDADQLARAVAHARAELPREACGLVLGRELADGRVEVAALEPTRNATTAPAEDTFEVHPEDHLALERRARTAGLDVVGCWHSHPDSGARPSRTDLERAWPGWSYLIVGRAAHADVHVRSWRLDPSARFVEEHLDVRAASAPTAVSTPAPNRQR